MGRFLLTSALPYINGIKHLGNLAGSMLPADVHARFRRMQGHEVLFICATDEHGTPAELAAAQAGIDVRAYCDQQHAIQRSLYERFRLSFDWFGRSSCVQNHRLTQHFYQRLDSAGLIDERSTRQVYSVDDGRFLPDRYVVGDCPKCGCADARGDQCDECGVLLDPIQLIKPRSAVSGSTNLAVRETVHLFLRQTELDKSIREWVGSCNEWPQATRLMAHKYLSEALQDRSITRDLSWGVPVASGGERRPGFENKVFYVWFDAPIAYIAATIEWAEVAGTSWRRWWRLDEGADDVTYIQFMGKDNVAFHAVTFPATLIGSGEAWKRVDRLKAFHWVKWYDGKFSTSEKRGVFMDDAAEILPIDCWRWRLTANSPETADSPFTWIDFQHSVNSDLVNVLGNFVNRVVCFCEARFDSRVPVDGVAGIREHDLANHIALKLEEITTHHEAMEFRKAAAATRALWVAGNEYLQASAPWSTIKAEPAQAAVAIRTALNLCRLFGVVALPIMPNAGATILQGLRLNPTEQSWPSAAPDSWIDVLPRDGLIYSIPVLFPKLGNDKIADWVSRFGGTTSTQSPNALTH